jgi:hypothetical protein
VFDWRRQFGPALDQTIFGLERHDPLVMSGAAAILALVAGAMLFGSPFKVPHTCFHTTRHGRVLRIGWLGARDSNSPKVAAATAVLDARQVG